MLDILQTNYNTKTIEKIKFELLSLIGRYLFNKKPPLTKGKNYLNLGCGPDIIDNWVNADFFYGIIPRKNKIKSNWMLDLRFALNCDDNVWDGVFTEHTLEHLYPDQALFLLNELNRTMKPGAVIRIIVPDLKKYVDFYNHKNNNEGFERYRNGCEAIHFITQKYRHLSAWDAEELAYFLEKSRFINIKICDYRQGRDTNIIKDKKIRAWESLYVEAEKNII